MPGFRFVAQRTETTSQQKNTQCEICYSHDRHRTTSKTCLVSDMLLKWRTWHHYKRMLGVRYGAKMTNMAPQKRMSGIRHVYQIPILTLTEPIRRSFCPSFNGPTSSFKTLSHNGSVIFTDPMLECNGQNSACIMCYESWKFSFS